jgi:hypothetical protein
MTQESSFPYSGHQKRGPNQGKHGRFNASYTHSEQRLLTAPPRDAPPHVLAAYLAERRQRWPRLAGHVSTRTEAKESEALPVQSAAEVSQDVLSAAPNGGRLGEGASAPRQQEPACRDSVKPKALEHTCSGATKQRAEATQTHHRAETRPTALFRALLEPDARLEERQEVLLDCLETIARQRGWVR